MFGIIHPVPSSSSIFLYFVVNYLVAPSKGIFFIVFPKRYNFATNQTKNNPEFKSMGIANPTRIRKERLPPNSALKLATPIKMEIPSPLNAVRCFAFLSLLVASSSAPDGDAASDTYVDD